MKRILFIIVIVLSSATVFAQTLAPITGSAIVCQGGTTALSDATPGGTWSSSTTSVAVISSSGVVGGIALGTSVITYTVGTAYVTMLITVKPIPTLTPSTINGCVNSNYTISASPSGGAWTSSDVTIATVNFIGVVTGVAPGTATITYTAAGGCSTNATFNVNPIPAPITGTNYVYSGLTTGLSDLTAGGVWSSGNPSLATVSGSGVVTGVSAGLLLISYTLPTTGCAAVYRVEVDPLPARTNLQAWYPFCGDTTDHSGPAGSFGGHDLIDHGILTTPALLDNDRFGSPNSAYQFNGVNSMMNYTTFFPNSGTPPDFTYSCWVNPAGPQSSIILYNGNINTNGFGFIMSNGTRGVAGNQVGVYFGGSGTLYASQTLTPGWHNLVLVKNGGVYNFYIDNAPGVFFIETTTPVFSDVFVLGANYESTLGAGPVVEAYSGDIDDIAIINRQLTNAERLSLFNYNPDARKFSLGNDTTICSDIINLLPVPQTIGGLYTWSRFNGLGYTVIDTTDTLLTVYPLSGGFGNYYALTISKPYGCIASDTIIVYKAPIPVNLGADLNQCIGDTITLTNFFPSASFLWSTGDTTHSIKVTSSGTYYVTVDSVYYPVVGGPDSSICVGRDTVNIYFHAPPVIGLPATVSNCNGAPDTLRPYFDSVYTYFWNTGTTGDSLIVSSSGTYWVRVSDSGCKRSDTSQVLIVYDTVSFYRPDTAICKNASVQIRGDNVTFNSIVGYQWTPTAGISPSNVAYPVITPDTSAEYYMHVTYPGCPDIVDSFHIDVQPNPTVFMGGNYDVCVGDTIHINASVTPDWYARYIYNWSPATSLDCSTCSTVVFTPGDTVKMILTVTTPAWRVGLATGCIGVDSGMIFVHPNLFDTLRQSASMCPGDSIQLIPNLDSLGNVTNTIVTAYRWSPGLYLDDSTTQKPWVHPITSQTYRLIAYSQFGCRDTLSVDIHVYPAAVITLGDSVTIFPGDSYHITPQTNCVYFLWYPPLGLDNAYVADPTATPDVNTSYIVNAITEDGCTVTDSFKIHIDPTSLIGIPNAFTPGASVNSKFYVMKRGLVTLNYFRVFDRWGDMVFETKNISEGWDGTYNGKPQPFGVYVYEVEAVTNTGKVFKRVGNVTLLK